MTDYKSFFASKAVLGGIVALLAGLLGLFGFTFGVEDQAALVEQVTNGVGMLGAVVAIYGRVVATKRIE